MCGRVAFTRLAEVLAYLEIHDVDEAHIRTTDDGRPTSLLPVVTGEAPHSLQALRWGLIPPWTKPEPDGRLPRWVQSTFNAVSEEVEKKPAFRSAFKAQRCLVPVDGFYEWSYPGGVKKTGKGVKHFFTRQDGKPLVFAGLWEHWNGPEGEVKSFTILTCAPNRFMSAYHDRMPVILHKPDFAKWLSGSIDEARPLMTACGEGELAVNPPFQRQESLL
jgi:putative SOS response-associated peptidase YedK